MGTKGERTKQTIIEKSSGVFNQRSYLGTSMEDIVAATGYQKGGVYRHFAGKEQLAVMAYRHAIEARMTEIAAHVADKPTGRAKLLAVAAFYADMRRLSDIDGGCPVFNVIDEAERLPNIFRDLAAESLARMRAFLSEIVRDAVTAGEIRVGTDADAVANLLLALLSGGVSMSRTDGDTRVLAGVTAHFAAHLETLTTR
ncbi:MAG: TetR/AcrR family transcriptional regulator [Chloroflexota bacterium]